MLESFLCRGRFWLIRPEGTVDELQSYVSRCQKYVTLGCWITTAAPHKGEEAMVVAEETEMTGKSCSDFGGT